MILCGETGGRKQKKKALVFRRRNCVRAKETMDVSEPEPSCCFGSLTNSSDASYSYSALLHMDFRTSIILQCSPSVRQRRANVGGHEVTQATDFFFILWNINLSS